MFNGDLSLSPFGAACATPAPKPRPAPASAATPADPRSTDAREAPPRDEAAQ